MITGMLTSSSLQVIFEESLIKHCLKITEGINHILYKEYELKPSRKRYRVSNCYLT